MSLDLHDLRLKVTPLTHAWLSARARVTGDDINTIVRDLLDLHSRRELEIAKVADALMRREGLPGIAGEGRG